MENNMPNIDIFFFFWKIKITLILRKVLEPKIAKKILHSDSCDELPKCVWGKNPLQL